ncbi:MAG: PAS domain-containing sensor histidine kinase, partial [Candidatus Muiribacteriaceae bacterium]
MAGFMRELLNWDCILYGLTATVLLFSLYYIYLFICNEKKKTGVFPDTVFFKSFPLPVFIKDSDGRYIYVNKAFERLNGRPAGYYIGRTVFDITRTDIAQKYRNMDELLFENPSETQVYESVLVTKNGEERPVVFQKYIVQNEKGESFLLGIIEDREKISNLTSRVTDDENILKFFINNSPYLVVGADSSGRIKFANYKTEELLGVTFEELKGKDIFKVFDHYTFSEDRDDLLMRFLQEDMSNFETYVSDEHGRLHTILWNTVRVKSENKDTEVYGFGMDISHIMKMHGQIESMIRNMPLAYIEWGNDLTVKRWNRKAEEIFGYSSSEAVGENLIDLVVPENLRGDVIEVVDKIINMTGGNRHINMNHTKDGTKIFCQWINITLPDKNGKVESYISFVDDVSEKVYREEKLNSALANLTSLVQNTEDSIMLADSDGFPILFNKAYEDLMYRISGTRVRKGYKSHLVLSDSRRNWWEIMYRKALGGNTFRTEYSFIDKSGNPCHYEMLFNPIRDKDSIIGFSVFSRDITKRKVTEKRLIQARQKAEEANNAKSNFISNISHEIRTPLHGIISIVDMLKKTAVDRKQIELLDLAAGSGKILSDIINDVLDFSKIESGRMILEKNPFYIHSVIKDVVEQFRRKCESKDISLHVEVADNVPECVRGDEVRFEQVLINIIGNAVKFTEKGYIRVKADVNESLDSVYFVNIQIEDTGMGIEPDKQEQIFDLFTQLDQSITRRFGGSGLGLSITKKIIDMMKGDISLESVPGEGSKFTVSIPFTVVRE